MKNNSAVGRGHYGEMNFCKKVLVFECGALYRDDYLADSERDISGMKS